MTDCGTGDPAYWSATMSPGTARMMTKVRITALRVDLLVEVRVVVVGEVQALPETRRRPELRELQVGLVEEVAVEVEGDVEVAGTQVGLVRGGLLHVVGGVDADLLPLVEDEHRNRLVRR